MNIRSIEESWTELSHAIISIAYIWSDDCQVKLISQQNAERKAFGMTCTYFGYNVKG